MIRDDFSGKVEKVNVALLNLLLDAGYTPVVTPPACSTDGEAINVDGDRAAAMIASAVGAKRLIILSNIPGLLREFPDESSLIRHIKYSELDKAMDFAEGRMKKKVLGAAEAIDGGVEQVIFGDARIANPIQTAAGGQGTVIER